ncbi:MAG: hypothetical protein GC180_01410 [Bacteroidetes bacterium]|nr:hypothetical protein [Bacteroidota bacterium]
MLKSHQKYVLQWIGLFVLLSVVFLFYSYPLMDIWGSQTIGKNGAFSDTPQILSNLYLFDTSWDSGDLFYTDQLFVPLGESTLFHGLIPLMGGMYQIFGGEPLAFLNYFIFSCTLLAGWGAFRLAKEFSPGFWGPALVAMLYLFGSFRMAQWKDHIWFVVNFVPPWYFLYFRRIFTFHPIRLQSWKALIICFLLGLVSVSLEFYTTFFLIYLSIGYLLYRSMPPLFPESWTSRKKVLVTIFGIVALSLLVDLFRKWGIDDHHGLYWTGDLTGLFIPYTNRIYSWLVPQVPNWLLPGADEKVMFLGFSLILALIPAKIFYWKQGPGHRDPVARHLFIFNLILLILCFPVVKLFGHTFLKLPSAFLHFIPFVNNVRVPGRWIMFLYLFLPLFLIRVYGSRFSGFKREGIFLLLTLVLIAEHLPKAFDFFPQEVDRARMETIKKMPGQVLLPVPFGVRDGYRMIGQQDNRFMYEQTLHQKKLIGGYLSRVDRSIFDYYAADPFCSDMFTKMSHPDSKIIPREYSHFFEKFHPDIIDVREEYRNGELVRKIKESFIDAGVQLIEVESGLYRVQYPDK